MCVARRVLGCEGAWPVCVWPGVCQAVRGDGLCVCVARCVSGDEGGWPVCVWPGVCQAMKGAGPCVCGQVIDCVCAGGNADKEHAVGEARQWSRVLASVFCRGYSRGIPGLFATGVPG